MSVCLFCGPGCTGACARRTPSSRVRVRSWQPLGNVRGHYFSGVLEEVEAKGTAAERVVANEVTVRLPRGVMRTHTVQPSSTAPALERTQYSPPSWRQLVWHSALGQRIRASIRYVRLNVLKTLAEERKQVREWAARDAAHDALVGVWEPVILSRRAEAQRRVDAGRCWDTLRGPRLLGAWHRHTDAARTWLGENPWASPQERALQPTPLSGAEWERLVWQHTTAFKPACAEPIKPLERYEWRYARRWWKGFCWVARPAPKRTFVFAPDWDTTAQPSRVGRRSVVATVPDVRVENQGHGVYRMWDARGQVTGWAWGEPQKLVYTAPYSTQRKQRAA